MPGELAEALMPTGGRWQNFFEFLHPKLVFIRCLFGWIESFNGKYQILNVAWGLCR